jgi:hypothetical protein
MDQSDFCIHLSNHHFAVASSAWRYGLVEGNVTLLCQFGFEIAADADTLCGHRMSAV